MRTLNVHEAKMKLSAVLLEVERKGETFIICRNGKPVAKIVPH
jgi:prevent-host-death family protein